MATAVGVGVGVGVVGIHLDNGGCKPYMRRAYPAMKAWLLCTGG